MYNTLMYLRKGIFTFMNLGDYEFVEISQKSNDAYKKLDVLSYSDDIIENKVIRDPDLNFIDEKNNSTCHYFTDEQFKSNANSESGFSIIHENCRSLYANTCYLKMFYMIVIINFISLQLIKHGYSLNPIYHFLTYQFMILP